MSFHAFSQPSISLFLFLSFNHTHAHTLERALVLIRRKPLNLSLSLSLSLPLSHVSGPVTRRWTRRKTSIASSRHFLSSYIWTLAEQLLQPSHSLSLSHALARSLVLVPSRALSFTSTAHSLTLTLSLSHCPVWKKTNLVLSSVFRRSVQSRAKFFLGV